MSNSLLSVYIHIYLLFYNHLDFYLRHRCPGSINLFPWTQRSCPNNHILQSPLYTPRRLLFHMGTKTRTSSAHFIKIFFRLCHGTDPNRPKLHSMCRLVNRQLHRRGTDTPGCQYDASNSHCRGHYCDRHFNNRRFIYGVPCSAPI